MYNPKVQLREVVRELGWEDREVSLMFRGLETGGEICEARGAGEYDVFRCTFSTTFGGKDLL